MAPVTPSEISTAARVADGLVYVAGIAGVVAGAMLFRQGDIAFAVVAWTVTFIAGAVLRLAAWASRGIARLMSQVERIESDLAVLLRDRAAQERDESDGPWGGGWH